MPSKQNNALLRDHPDMFRLVVPVAAIPHFLDALEGTPVQNGFEPWPGDDRLAFVEDRADTLISFYDTRELPHDSPLPGIARRIAMPHDLVLYHSDSGFVREIRCFRANAAGEYVYFCTHPGAPVRYGAKGQLCKTVPPQMTVETACRLIDDLFRPDLSVRPLAELVAMPAPDAPHAASRRPADWFPPRSVARYQSLQRGLWAIRQTLGHLSHRVNPRSPDVLSAADRAVPVPHLEKRVQALASAINDQFRQLPEGIVLRKYDQKLYVLERVEADCPTPGPAFDSAPMSPNCAVTLPRVRLRKLSQDKDTVRPSRNATPAAGKDLTSFRHVAGVIIREGGSLRIVDPATAARRNALPMPAVGELVPDSLADAWI